MSWGISLFLMAVGAALTWGITVNPRGLDLDVIGVILMVVGAVGLLLSLLFWTSFAPFRSDREIVVDDPHHHHYA